MILFFFLMFSLSACTFEDEVIRLQPESTATVFVEDGLLAAPPGHATWLTGKHLPNESSINEDTIETLSFHDNNKGKYSSLSGLLINFDYLINSTEAMNFSQICENGTGSYTRSQGHYSANGQTFEMILHHIVGQCDNEFQEPASCFLMTLVDNDNNMDQLLFEKSYQGCQNVSKLLSNIDEQTFEVSPVKNIWLHGRRFTIEDVSSGIQRITFNYDYSGDTRDTENNLSLFEFSLFNFRTQNLSQICENGVGAIGHYTGTMNINGESTPMQLSIINGLCDAQENIHNLNCFRLELGDENNQQNLYFEKSPGGCDDAIEYLASDETAS